MSKIKMPEDWEAEDTREKRLEEAAKFYTKLRLELATRSDNEHVGSGMGGNASEFFFLLSHKVRLEISPDRQCHFSRTGSHEILFEVHKAHDIKLARKELTRFIDTHPDKLDITQEQLLDETFLKEHQSKSLDIKLLARAIAEAKILAGWLDHAEATQSYLRTAFGKEYKAIEAAFLKEMDMPVSYFEDINREDEDAAGSTIAPIGSMLDEHPIWGARKKAVSKRHEKMLKQLLSQDDLERLTFIGTFPEYTALFSFRSVIRIERIVRLNLDELPECNFLSKINSSIKER